MRRFPHSVMHLVPVAILLAGAGACTDPNVEDCGDHCPGIDRADAGDGDAGPAPADAASDATTGDADASPPAGDGDAAAPVDAGDGAGDGGAGSDAGDGGDAGDSGEPMSDPCEQCPGERPFCNGADDCVQCLLDGDCAGGVCEDEQCVECRQDADCSDPAASRCRLHECVPCSFDAECAHFPDRGVCDGGDQVCVECTAQDYDDCGTDPDTGRARVCDSLTRSCAEATEASAGLCQSCVSDAQCNPGQLCVLQRRQDTDIGWVCLWQEGATAGGAPGDCFAEGRPYIQQLATTSIDGVVANVCDLAVSTCPALQDFRDTDCAPTGTPDEALCGHPEVADSACVQASATTYRCTTRCSSSDDCRTGHSCITSPEPPLCSLQAN